MKRGEERVGGCAIGGIRTRDHDERGVEAARAATEARMPKASPRATAGGSAPRLSRAPRDGGGISAESPSGA